VNKIVDIRDPQDIYDNCGTDPIIIDMEGDIAAKAKDLGLSNVQFSLLRQVVQETINDACDDINILIPKEISDKYEKFENKTEKYYKKVTSLEEKHGDFYL